VLVAVMVVRDDWSLSVPFRLCSLLTQLHISFLSPVITLKDAVEEEARLRSVKEELLMTLRGCRLTWRILTLCFHAAMVVAEEEGCGG
jgi:hypothetical protein